MQHVRSRAARELLACRSRSRPKRVIGCTAFHPSPRICGWTDHAAARVDRWVLILGAHGRIVCRFRPTSRVGAFGTGRNAGASGAAKLQIASPIARLLRLRRSAGRLTHIRQEAAAAWNPQAWHACRSRSLGQSSRLARAIVFRHSALHNRSSW
jgi:hypothetical protein